MATSGMPTNSMMDNEIKKILFTVPSSTPKDTKKRNEHNAYRNQIDSNRILGSQEISDYSNALRASEAQRSEDYFVLYRASNHKMSTASTPTNVVLNGGMDDALANIHSSTPNGRERDAFRNQIDSNGALAHQETLNNSNILGANGAQKIGEYYKDKWKE